jgi:hypothetical protein
VDLSIESKIERQEKYFSVKIGIKRGNYYQRNEEVSGQTAKTNISFLISLNFFHFSLSLCHSLVALTRNCSLAPF